MKTLISTIICTCNRANYLSKAIQSLLEQTLDSNLYEIIVVDNCSTDDTKQIVTQEFAHVPNLRYIYEPVLGLSQARNTGWQNARGEYVAYLDDDAVACSVWLEKILEVFETVTPKPGCVGGKAQPIWEASRPNWLSDDLITGLTVIDWFDTPQVLPDLSQKWLVGANIAFPREVLKQIGGFISGLDRVGKNLLSGGDIFLEKQIVKAGYCCFYHPEIAVSHHIQKSRLEKRWFVRRYYWQGISDAAVQLIEESPSRLRCFRSAISRSIRLLRSPKKLARFLLFKDDPKLFTQKCFTLIEIGHIAGLLGVIRRQKETKQIHVKNSFN
jgi:glycosyltransferase involved in cell wall biosynthesis